MFFSAELVLLYDPIKSQPGCPGARYHDNLQPWRTGTALEC